MEYQQRYDTFLGLEPTDQQYEASRVVLLPVPYEGTVSYRGGTRLGPKAIIDASNQVELWDLELKREICSVGIYTLPTLAPVVSGPEQMVKAVEQICEEQLEQGKFVFLLGGEHSVSLGLARALHRRFEALSFLQIDAHLDLRDSYEGSPYSHAAVGRRLLELGQLVHVGARTGCPEELDVITQHRLSPLWADEICTRSGLDADRWIDRVIDQLGPYVYVSLDVDGLDPSVIPATGTPVPGGLTWYQSLALLRAVGERRRVVGCDLCELAPIPGQVASDFAAALLAYKMVGYFVCE